MFLLLAAAIMLPLAAMNNVTAQDAELPGENTGDNVTKSDEKQLIKTKLKEKMAELSKKDFVQKNSGINYTADEYGIPYNMVFVDDSDISSSRF